MIIESAWSAGIMKGAGMTRKFFTEEHDIFRDAFRRYLKKEVEPYIDEWEEKRDVPRSAWKGLGEQGFLCPWVDEAFGGSGAGFEYAVIINEELTRVGANGFQVGLHSDIIVPYIDSFGSDEQKRRWLPGCCTGDLLTAIAMTEPGAGSDLQGIRTKAVREGDDFILNGQKTFISNGSCCDLVIVVVRTDPEAQPPHKGISLIVVEDGTPGFIKARRLEKMGLHSADTSELFFEDCRVPASNLLGRENMGFAYLMQKLQRERLIVSIQAQTAAEVMLEKTVEYCRTREAFGRPIGSFQHNTFKLAEMATEVELGRTFINALVSNHLEGRDITRKVSMAKWWIAEMANRVAYHGVQLHGGYGYMEEYPICRWYRDIRASSIYAGTSEVMKQVIGKSMGF
jgi:acyl-CoA dehydrogenase